MKLNETSFEFDAYLISDLLSGIEVTIESKEHKYVFSMSPINPEEFEDLIKEVRAKRKELGQTRLN